MNILFLFLSNCLFPKYFNHLNLNFCLVTNRGPHKDDKKTTKCSRWDQWRFFFLLFLWSHARPFSITLVSVLLLFFPSFPIPPCKIPSGALDPSSFERYVLTFFLFFFHQMSLPWSVIVLLLLKWSECSIHGLQQWSVVCRTKLWNPIQSGCE